MSHFILAQIISLLGVLMSLAVYQVNRRSVMLWLTIGATILYGISCLYLEAYTGALLDFLIAVQCYAFWKSDTSKQNLVVFGIFSVCATAITVVTWSGLVSFLPFAGALVSSFASSQLMPKNIRRLALLSTPFWLAFAVVIHSYPAAIINIAILISNIFGQLRFDRKRLPA